MIVHPKAHEYQRKALQFSLDNRISYQSLDIGLGKTLIALMWANNIEHKGILVISTIKIVYNVWPNEIQKWCPDTTYAILHGPDKLKELHKKADIYLTNFESIVWLFAAIKKMKRVPFNVLIIDEGSKMKAHNTKRFKALRAMRDIFSAGKLILSGTPAPNSLLNLWSQYYLLDDGIRLGKAYGEFQAKYFTPLDQMGRSWAIKPGCAPIIHERIRDITFRLEGTDYITMPKRIDNFIKVKFSPDVQRKYETLESDFFLKLAEGKSIEVFNSMALSMKLRQFVQGAVYTDKQGNYEVMHEEKLQALKDLVETSDGTPILCAIQFIFELDLIRKVFPETPVIRGGVSNIEATRLVNAWNKRELPLLLCHPASLSHGMNMQYGGNTILWYGLPWSGEIYEQFIGRLKRQGQESEVVVVNHLTVQNTVDVAVAASLKAKAKGQQALLDYLNAYHNGTVEDI